MEKRQLGTSDLHIAPLAFGGNVFGWTADEKTSHQLLDAVVDHGIDLVDTADVYSAYVEGNKGGESETIIGNWLKKSGKRDKIVLATKVGMPVGSFPGNLKRETILKCFDDSLKRLQTDYVDLYQSHKDDPTTPHEEVLTAYETLIKQGKVRYIGASNFSGPRLAEALSTSGAKNLPAYVSLQPEYNLYDRADYEQNLEAVCLQHNVGVISYFGLASGFLTGKYRKPADVRGHARGSRVEKYTNDRGWKILNALDRVAAEHNTPLAVIALAWLMRRPSVTAPIASARTLGQLAEIAQAMHIVLTDTQVQTLNAASAY